RQCMDVALTIRRRKTPGGPGLRQVGRMLQQRAGSLAREMKWIRSCRESIRKAARMTDQRAKQIIK
ncbi:MAG TPA: hypothetical protein VLM91_02800, partial [Candidatus Methylomirabilis sp.]|nr:hypothetical protein [Candidatus Methylomirabilis sp.]